MLTLDKVLVYEQQLLKVKLLYELEEFDNALLKMQEIDKSFRLELEGNELNTLTEDTLMVAINSFLKSLEKLILSVSEKKSQTAHSISEQIKKRKNVNVYKKIKG